MQLTGRLQPPPGLGQKILIGSFFDDDLSLDPKIGAFFGEDLFGQNRPIFWRRPFWDQIGPYLILGKQLHRPVIMDRPRNFASKNIYINRNKDRPRSYMQLVNTRILRPF